MAPSSQDPEHVRRFPAGAEVINGLGVHFRVWAPERKRLELVLYPEMRTPDAAGMDPEQYLEMKREPNGYFSLLTQDAHPGSLYRFRLDGEEGPFPDPASRFQPEGPHGPSQVIDPGGFSWTDRQWLGIEARGQVLYEVHIGTFTQEGTWDAAAAQLAEIASCGITVLEVMPVAEFPGDFGWGYDGVNLYAPTRLYGSPDDFRHFVDRAHAAGLGVILDVVYNHFGPDGNFIGNFAPRYFSDTYENEWGDAINFDGKAAGAVREFFAANAAYWIEEFHLDGLRLDATQSIHDQSADHILGEISRRVRAAAGGRATFLVAENERQETRLVRPGNEGGYGFDAIWNDDFHHSAVAALTGRNEAYYVDTPGSAQELVSAVKYGFLFQGQHYLWQKAARGTPGLDLDPCNFVLFLENHDQVANSATGERLWQRSNPARYRAMTALLLLAPGLPMLFQGQEFASSRPFLYFAHHTSTLAASVRGGRAEFLAQFPSYASLETLGTLADPSDRETFERCKLDFRERETHASTYTLHRDLLRLRREDPVLFAPHRRSVDGAVLSRSAFVLRWFAQEGPSADRILLVNFGPDIRNTPLPEPLLAPPRECVWHVRWCSEDPAYGGTGIPPFTATDPWTIPGESAVLFAAGPPAPERSPEVRS